MGTKKILSHIIHDPLRLPSPAHCLNRKGQQLVEFTLCLALLLVILWIPADFGLAMYAGQIASNAAREGARIAAADLNPPPGIPDTCGPPLSNCFSLGVRELLSTTAKRLPGALMRDASVSLESGGAGCNQTVIVTVSGTYRFWFYQLLRLLGGSTTIPDTRNIARRATMRWEHQAGCAP